VTPHSSLTAAHRSQHLAVKKRCGFTAALGGARGATTLHFSKKTWEMDRNGDLTMRHAGLTKEKWWFYWNIMGIS
jgi:hypothetical protein